MGAGGRKGLFALATIMALALAALIYFLFVVHPEPREGSASGGDSPSATPAAPQLLRAPLPPLAADETDLCGYGRVKRSAVDDIRAQAQEVADKAFGGLKAKFAASPDPRDAALGLYLQESTAPLAKLASASRDPQVYALAFLSCRYRADWCPQLSAEQWGSIEPDNAVPWLLIASAASNTAARDEAIYRASAAQRSDARFPNLLGLLQRPEIRSLAPQARSILAEDLMGLNVTLPGLPYQPFYRFCNFPSVAEPSHLGVCGSLAKLLLERDHTLLGFAVGAKLAQSADWPPDVVSRLGEQRVQYQAAFTGAVSQETAKTTSDCEAMAAFDRWAADYSSLGDRGVAIKFIQENSAAGAKSKQDR